MPKLPSARRSPQPKLRGSPEPYHPFRNKPACGFEAFAGGFQFITGKIAYGESYFANGLLFEDSKTGDRRPLGTRSNGDLEGATKCKKRLSGEFEPMQGAENQSGQGSPIKKQKFMPPQPRGKSSEDREEPPPEECPLCLETLDATDQQFEPCGQCSYKVCLYCHGRIMENDCKCPGCRTPYCPPDQAETVKQQPQKPQQPRQQQQQPRQQQHQLAPEILSCELNANAASFILPVKERPSEEASPALFDLTQTFVPPEMMGRIRVIQRNLMYITNMPPSMADQRKLASLSHFGAFGPVARLVLRTIPACKAHQLPVVSAYVTYANEASTAQAIQALNGKFVDGKRLRASFGSNKYCNSFIRNEPCSNPRCSYLHQLSGTHECFWEKAGKK